jgi:hypothetical protein
MAAEVWDVALLGATSRKPKSFCSQRSQHNLRSTLPFLKTSGSRSAQVFQRAQFSARAVFLHLQLRNL